MRVVDFVAWLKRSFAPADWVVVKMDIEGAEYPIFERLLDDASALRLIDVLALEVHPWGRDGTRFASSEHLIQSISRAAPSMRLVPHDEWARGFDSRSGPPSDALIAQSARSCALKHHRAAKASRQEAAQCAIVVSDARTGNKTRFAFDAASGPADSADFVERTTQWVVERLSDPDHAKVAITVRDMMEYERDGCLQRARRSEAIERWRTPRASSIGVMVTPRRFGLRPRTRAEELASIARDWSLAAGDESYFEAVARRWTQASVSASARQANRAALGLRAPDVSNKVARGRVHFWDAFGPRRRRGDRSE